MLWTVVPLVPVIVMGYVPVGVVAELVTVSVLVKGGVPLVGLSEAVIPDPGWEAVSVTVWEVPLTKLTVTLAVLLPP